MTDQVVDVLYSSVVGEKMIEEFAAADGLPFNVSLYGVQVARFWCDSERNEH